MAVDAAEGTTDALSSGGINEPVDTSGSAPGVGDFAAVDVGDATDIPGGGDATTSGSSMSSSGKSGSCSWNGEAGTPAKPFGMLALSAVGDATDSMTGLAAAGEGEGPLGATPSGRETFREPVVPPSGVDVLRAAVPAVTEALEGPAPLIETPTGREAPAGVAATTPGRWEPAPEVPFTPTAAAVGTPAARAEEAPEGAAVVEADEAADADRVPEEVPAAPGTAL